MKSNKSFFSREIAFLAVLNFFPDQKLIFGHFWNCKKLNLVKKFFREIDLFDFTRFFDLEFWIFWPPCEYPVYPSPYHKLWFFKKILEENFGTLKNSKIHAKTPQTLLCSSKSVIFWIEIMFIIYFFEEVIQKMFLKNVSYHKKLLRYYKTYFIGTAAGTQNQPEK